MVESGAGDGVQLSLLQGFPESAAASPGIALAPVNPVARVRLESGVPHLDRPFDYSVPASLDQAAVPGVRVKVSFNGQDLSGYLLERRETSAAGHILVPLQKVVSAVPVLTPATLQLAESVAARYAGTVSDVLRVAVPPRVARLDKEYLARNGTGKSGGDGAAAGAAPGADPVTPLAGDFLLRSAWADYRSGNPFLLRLASGAAPRATVTALHGYGPKGWPALLAHAVAAVRASGRGAVVVVPDYRDLDRLEEALSAVLPVEDVVRLSADDGPAIRYGNFLRLLEGSAGVAIGTRSAAYAPVMRPGLFVCWDDGDDLHCEQRAPYAHTREVLLLRAEQEQAACLLAGHSRSTEVQRLVEQGWAVAVEPDRKATRAATPRILNTADSFEQERDPLARVARLPGAAWKAAQDGLLRGPVLVQVARAGYAPSLVCDSCREPARCTACQGPLAVAGGTGPASVPQCRWCSTPAPAWACRHCGSRTLRRGATGVIRTAEELGKAFPGRPVITSSGDHVKAVVGDASALVVATVGAEPVAAGGYAAALLLDGDALLRRESLRAGEDAVRRWFNAAALVRPATAGGLVVVTAADTSAVGALLRWDPPGYAERELALRRELHLPPAVRIASVTGQSGDVAFFTAAVQRQLEAAGLELRTAGPAPVVLTRTATKPGAPGEAEVRTLMFIPYADAAVVTRILRAVRASGSAKRSAGPVQLRLDGTDVL